MEQNFDDYKMKLDEFVNKGSTEWDSFLEWWKTKNSEPTEQVIIKEKVSFNIKFWLALVAGIGALFLSAFRVSERFYSVAGGDLANPFFSVGEAISAVFAVNVTIFALAVAYAYTTNKVSEYSQTLGLGTAIVISAVAGLGQAAKALGPEWSAWVSVFDLVLAAVLGIGATALEYFSGDLLGVEIVHYYLERKVVNDKYEQSVLSERSRIVHEHKEWLKAAKGQFGLFMGNFKKFNEQPVNSEQTTGVHEQTSERSQKHKLPPVDSVNAVNIIKSVLEQTGELLGTSELSRRLAVNTYGYDVNNLTHEQTVNVQNFIYYKKGAVHKIRDHWIEENNVHK